MREKLGIENKVVIGHIGRFNLQKNHKFLIDIFNEALKNRICMSVLGLGLNECSKGNKLSTKEKIKNIRDVIQFFRMRI